jgi:L-threonylcarbamoyladenylate synthase
MKTEIISVSQPSAIRHALDVLRNGGLVAFPTDTVYGLAAPVDNAESIERLYTVKGRTNTKAIAVLLGDAADLEKVVVSPSQKAQRLADAFWPGPLTLILPRHPGLPEVLSPLSTVGVRIPDHPVALALLRATGPLAVTSANRSGDENTLTAEQVYAQLQGRIHLILDGGATPGGVPSTVVDCTSGEPKILREGPITLDEILEAARR